MRTKVLAEILILVLLAFSVSVLGDTIATDWTVGQGGTVSFDGVSTLSGTGLPVSSILGVGTPLNAGVQLSVSSGSLSFTDSNFAGLILGDLTWGPGAPGTLSITGSINGGNNITLLGDSFQSLTVAPLGATSFQVTIGQIQGTLDSSVANYYGIDPNFTASSLQLTLSSVSGSLDGGAFSSTNMGGTINADPVAATEPWNFPIALIFFGVVASIFGLLTRAKVLRLAVAV